MFKYLKGVYSDWYRKHFWAKEDYLGEIVGLRRKRWESDKMLQKRIEERYKQVR